MLLFLKKIRSQLLRKNRITTYLMYAFGEVILVVLGILLALQINTWNEDRIRAKKEKVYLERLLSENNQDLQTYTALINDLNLGIEAAENLSFALNEKNKNDSTVVFFAKAYFQYASIVPNFSSSRSTFDDLSSTGNLEIISEVSMRDQIVAHYANVERIQERMKINNDWALLLDGPFQSENKIMEFERTTSHLFPKRSPSEQAKELRKNKVEYINNAAVHHWVNQDGIRLLNELIKSSTQLTNSLTEALQKE